MNLKELIEYVENNNEINDASWHHWDDAQHIINTYIDDKYNDEYCSLKTAIQILNNAISSDGATLEMDINVLRKKIWGNATIVPDLFLMRYLTSKPNF